MRVAIVGHAATPPRGSEAGPSRNPEWRPRHRGGAHWVPLLGLAPPEDLPRLFCQAYAFVLTSLSLQASVGSVAHEGLRRSPPVIGLDYQGSAMLPDGAAVEPPARCCLEVLCSQPDEIAHRSRCALDCDQHAPEVAHVYEDAVAAEAVGAA
jgi:hypothetical protein